MAHQSKTRRAGGAAGLDNSLFRNKIDGYDNTQKGQKDKTLRVFAIDNLADIRVTKKARGNGVASQPEADTFPDQRQKSIAASVEATKAKATPRKARGGGNGKSGDEKQKRTPQADKLIELSMDAKLFHDADGNCYADLDIDGHRETRRVKCKEFSGWLKRRYFESENAAPNNEAMATAIGMIEAHAHYKAPERKVFVRSGGMDGKIYIDLCDAAWRAVEIDVEGWRIVNEPPVRFRRSAGMQPLPIPVHGGTVGTLKDYLNVRSGDDFILAVSWLLAALRNTGPYPVLALAGEHGSAKSTFSLILRRLCDPNTAPLRSLPREDRDLFIAASNSHVLAFDNISGLPAWISDTLCRLATGGGFATRTLFTDQDETLFSASRPIILNGIEEIVTRPDLADRSIFLTLDPIPRDRRRLEKEILAAFELDCPKIFGTLLTALSGGLQRLPYTRLDDLPRMADFALWAAACEASLWDDGAFQAAYSRNIDGAVESVIEADAVACAVRDLMADRDEWEGTAAFLLVELSGIVSERVAKSKTWPADPIRMSGRLRRAAPLLRKIGVGIVFPSSHCHGRILTITNRPESARELTSSTSSTSRNGGTPCKFKEDSRDDSSDKRDDRPGGRDDSNFPATPYRPVANQLKNNVKVVSRDGEDVEDVKLPIGSGWDELA